MTTDNPILHEALKAVAGQAQTLTGAGPLAVAFYHWVLAEELPSEQSAPVARELCAEIASGGRSIHAVAALGFLLSIDPTLSDACRDSFAQGVDWLTGRSGGSQTAMASLMQTVNLSTTNFQTFSEIAFRFAFTPAIAFKTLLFALVMGFIGGFIPAWRAARMKIVDCLRAA